MGTRISLWKAVDACPLPPIFASLLIVFFKNICWHHVGTLCHCWMQHLLFWNLQIGILFLEWWQWWLGLLNVVAFILLQQKHQLKRLAACFTISMACW
jgi:hypothetical protein